MSFVTQLVPVATALATISLGLYTTILPQSKRPKFFAALIIIACLTWHTSKNLPFTLQFINQFLVAILFYLWHMFNLLFIHAYQIEPSSNSVSSLKKLRTAYYMNSNVRWLDTPHEVRDIIGRPTNQFILKKWEDKGEAVNKPLIAISRIHYVLRKIVDLVLFHFLEKLLKDTLHPTVTGHDFMTSRTHFIRRLLFQPNDLYPYKPSSRECMIRGYYSLVFFLGDYVLLHKGHSLLALVHVGLGIHRPEDWPRLFGPFSGLTKGVRGMWGVYWHKLHTRAYSDSSRAVLSKIGITRDHICFRPLANLIVFCVTGAAHVIVAKKMGYTCAGWLEFFWWLGNWAVLVLETLVEVGYKKVWRRMGLRRNAGFEKFVCFLWVLAWVFWSVPKITYQKLWCYPMV